MNELLQKIILPLIISAVVFSAGAIWRFETSAAELKKDIEEIQDDLKDHYTKKEEFVVVKNDIKHIKQKQEKIEGKIELILEAVRR